MSLFLTVNLLFPPAGSSLQSPPSYAVTSTYVDPSSALWTDSGEKKRNLLVSPCISPHLYHLPLEADSFSALTHRFGERSRGCFGQRYSRPDDPRVDSGGRRRGGVRVPRRHLPLCVAQVHPCGLQPACCNHKNPVLVHASPHPTLSALSSTTPHRCTQRQIAILNMKRAAELAADLTRDGTVPSPAPQLQAPGRAATGASVGTSTRRGFGRGPRASARASGAASGASESGEARTMPGLIELDELASSQSV